MKLPAKNPRVITCVIKLKGLSDTAKVVGFSRNYLAEIITGKERSPAALQKIKSKRIRVVFGDEYNRAMGAINANFGKEKASK